MRVHFEALTLQCREDRVLIDFSSQISYFHGKISAGKSSIVRLIDYCLGGDLERTPAISQELVSVQLSAKIGEHDVLLERPARGSSQIQVTWHSDAGTGSVLAPLIAGPNSIWGSDIYNLSDLIFHLAGIRPIKVRKNKRDEESPLVRLSFRDMLWYCYLEQDTLDSSFYRLMEPYRLNKSRDAMRFITGFYTERLNELEIQLDELRERRLAKREALKQIRQFLVDYGYGTEIEIANELGEVADELLRTEADLASVREVHQASTHQSDALRVELRDFGGRLAAEEEALEDLTARMSEQEALRSELSSAKFKLARATSATAVLSGVNFIQCPLCGTELTDNGHHEPDACRLCGRIPQPPKEDPMAQAELIRSDLTARINDLTESIERHTMARKKQSQIVESLRQQKVQLDERLNQELALYDSAYLSSARQLERQLATLQERRRGLERTAKLLEAVGTLEREANELVAQEEELRQQIGAETSHLSRAEHVVNDIESEYLAALLQVGVPGVSPQDIIKINTRTWMPWIYPADGDPYNFYNAGSGGKKTLLNVCYALAIHKVARQNNLPLPTFLMIDTPMKNIGEDVNESLFRAFYDYLYRLAAGPLQATQFVIIDKEFEQPREDLELQVYQRYMSPDNPLIPYYRGP